MRPFLLSTNKNVHEKRIHVLPTYEESKTFWTNVNLLDIILSNSKRLEALLADVSFTHFLLYLFIYNNFIRPFHYT